VGRPTPLTPTRLLRKDKDTGFDVKFEWGPEEQAEFEFLTTGLADAVALEFPDWPLPFSLRTDASKVGFAAVLSQAIPKTKRAEKNYDPRELEVGCTVWALQHFRTWLLCIATSTSKRTTPTPAGSWTTDWTSTTASCSGALGGGPNDVHHCTWHQY
jgi:hypothetical protein